MANTVKDSKRMVELDSLRGIAAFIVFLSHAVGMVNPIVIHNINLNETPFRFFWDGHASVIFFFLLSGYVLSKNFFSDNCDGINIVSFSIKRIFRIYPAYLVSILVAFVICNGIYASQMNSVYFSEWFDKFWSSPITINSLIKHVLMIFGGYDTAKINPVIWSLVVEMRMSLLIPFVILLLRKYNQWVIFVLALVLSFTISSFYYFYIFVLGCMIAKNQELITGFFKQKNGVFYFLSICIAILLYGYKFMLSKLLDFSPFSLVDDNIWISAGASLILIMVLSVLSKDPSRLKVLRIGFITFLGKISYSFYLWHLIVLLAFRNFFGLIGNPFLYSIICLGITIVLSQLSYVFLESKMIELTARLMKTNAVQKLRFYISFKK